MQLQWRPAPANHWFALLAPNLPELAAARVDGTASLTARFTLPGQADTWQLQAQVQGLRVTGLGSASWAQATSACGVTPPLPARHWLVRAVLAAEDQRFYQHAGLDLRELGQALQRNQQAGAIRRGGSTLSQQLAKLMITGSERSLQRKLRELLYALDAESSLGKARILQLYLANAPWGHDTSGRLICGAEAAARHYYGVGALQLTPRQAVTLATMLRNPQREAQLLRETGHVNTARLLWIADQVRGVPPAQRRALLRQLQAESS